MRLGRVRRSLDIMNWAVIAAASSGLPQRPPLNLARTMPSVPFPGGGRVPLTAPPWTIKQRALRTLPDPTRRARSSRVSAVLYPSPNGASPRRVVQPRAAT